MNVRFNIHIWIYPGSKLNLDVHSNNQTSIVMLLQINFCMNILLPRFWLDIQLLLPTGSSATPLGALTLNGCLCLCLCLCEDVYAVPPQILVGYPASAPY